MRSSEMLWGSSTYTGYGKGKYSLALPAGVAVIGLLFLAVGVIIAIRFPGIVTDWTKVDVCILKETDKNYAKWVSNSDRDVTVSVKLRNITNLESVLKFGDEPQFDWVGPFNFTEQSRKKKVQFLPEPEHRVTFLKEIQYESEISSSENTYVSVPNLWLLRQYTRVGDPLLWLVRTLPQLLSETAADFGSNSNGSSFWINLTTIDCNKSNGIDSVDICNRFSISKLTRTSDFGALNKTDPPWRSMAVSIFTQLFDRVGNRKSILDKTCPNDFLERQQQREEKTENENVFQCPSCFGEQTALNLLLLDYRLLQTYKIDHPIWSHLKSCYADHRSAIIDNSINVRQFYAVLKTVDDYFFHHLRKALLLEIVSRKGIFQNDNALKTSVGETGDRHQLGILEALFGDGDHVYDWYTCSARWDVDADINFEWHSFDSRLIKWNSKSEYYIPPPSHIEPCLRPSAPRRFAIMLDGLWQPAFVTFDTTKLFYGETVYVYRLTAGSLPYDDDFLPEDLKINVTEVLGLPSFISPFTENGSGLNDIVANILVEPVSGSIWQVETHIELSVLIPDEILTAAHLPRGIENRISIARINRTNTVNFGATEFLTKQLKPMLAIICGGVVASTLLAMLFVGLALALVVKLHWVPIRERTQVQTKPQELELLNTIKLRKLLGN